MANDKPKDALSIYRYERLKRVMRRLDNNDWPNPYISFIGYSTPLNLDCIVNTSTIDSGLMGRPIFLRVADERAPLNTNRDLSEPTDDLASRFVDIVHDDNPISMTQEASALLQEIVDFFESNINHKELGAIYARGREHTLRISSLLAAETRMITCKELLFAMKLFLNSISSICDVLVGKSSDSLYPSAVSSLQKICEHSDLSVGVIANKLYNSNKHVRAFKSSNPKIAYELISRAISEGLLVQKGKIIGLSEVSTIQEN